MSLNLLPVQSVVRQPRGIVKLNGAQVGGWGSWTVDNNTFHGADTFRVSFVLAGLDDEHSADWFSRQTDIEVEILAGFPADPHRPFENELEQVILGKSDDVSLNLATRSIDINGRDHSSLLIDTKTAPVAYRNQTSSDIAKALAAKHGLAPQVTETTTRVGIYWDQDHVRLTDQRTEWDVLTYLAHEERFICYVKNKTLFFGPSPFDSATSDYYVLRWEQATDSRGNPVFNGTHLDFTRALTIAKGIVVEAVSYQTKSKKAVKSYYPRGSATHTNPGAADAEAQVYKVKLPPNKSVLEVEAAAKARYDEVVRHEMLLNARMPADHVLTISTAIKVEGTGTAFDQMYFPDSITRTMDMSEGYSMTVRAKNSNPTTSPSL